MILGESSTGKSTIAAALLGRPVEDADAERRDFAIGYEYADVRDEGDEGALQPSDFESLVHNAYLQTR